MKTKRVIIGTLNGYKNYGNRLQLFALSKILLKTGLPIYNYWPNHSRDLIVGFIRNKLSLRYRVVKYCKFCNFSRKNTPKITRHIRENDYIVLGSDQIWNPQYLKKRPYLLEPPAESKRIISYAASMGTDILPRHQDQTFRKALTKIEAISVREKSARQILRLLTKKEIEVVLDPTLLINRVDYEKLECKPKKMHEDEKYILCYILGNREQLSIIERYAKKHNLKIILFSDKRDSDYGVEEFLYLIHHAELICTDSFHACVFSFIFERPFIAFKRTGEANYMYTRLENLINTFKLKNREFDGKEITRKNLEVDYTEAKKILKKEQEKSLIFLMKALGETEWKL